ncbi:MULTISPECIES: hypothetical protein [unclassified Flavobacterium]|uniref:hypothetical protein n=1 Tax=unclassified Flavobacterium TaxID=196869 RepID=UPI0011C38903|nr:MULTISPECIES: hypothetical protein [unclassified Flavobacterium]
MSRREIYQYLHRMTPCISATLKKYGAKIQKQKSHISKKIIYLQFKAKTMTAETYQKIAKVFLIIPLIAGLLTIVEQFLPLQKVTTIVESKRISESTKSGLTYSIDFSDNNDQFIPEIYNQVKQGDKVNLEILYFTKEVKTLQLPESGIVLENSTNEVYFQLGIALVFVVFSGYFLRKNFFTNKNYRYIVILCLIGIVTLIRIISLNF